VQCQPSCSGSRQNNWAAVVINHQPPASLAAVRGGARHRRGRSGGFDIARPCRAAHETCRSPILIEYQAYLAKLDAWFECVVD
jgi:hypothetical protein